MRSFKIASLALLPLFFSACTMQGFFDKAGALLPEGHVSSATSSKNVIPNNLSMQNASEIELKMLALMPDAVLTQSGNPYDLFSYQASPWGHNFGLLNALTIAAGQPGGPSITIPNTTRTNLQSGGADAWFNGPLDLSTLPNFTIPKAFYPDRHFSVAFANKYGSILANMNGSPTPVSNIGFRSMTTDLCSVDNIKASPMYNIANAWLNGSASSDPITNHLHAMATQAWMTPLAVDASEIVTIRKVYADLQARALLNGSNASDASDHAYKGACQVILLSPQFWVGPAGKGQALIRATIRLAKRLPTQAEMRAYLANPKTFSTTANNLMHEDGFKATVGRWHIDSLGLQMATGGAFGGFAFKSLNWAGTTNNMSTRRIFRSPWVDPLSPGSGKAVWIGSPFGDMYETTAENLLHMSHWLEWFNTGPLGQGDPWGNHASDPAGGVALANYINTALNDANGKKHIVNQPFDNRTSGLWFRRFNTITNTMELVGGFILDLGNATDNGNELALQSGFVFSPGEVSTRCAPWAYHPSRWLICKGSVTILNDGTKQDVELSHIPLNVVTLGDGGGPILDANGNYYPGESFRPITLTGTWPTSGLGSDYSNLPLFGQHLAERWSPSGKQDGYSQVYLPQSNDKAWVSNTFARFDVSCVKKNTIHSNPAPDPAVATSPAWAWGVDPGCGGRSFFPIPTVGMDIAFADTNICGGAGYRGSSGYGNTSWGQHMDPLALDAYHCGAVNTATLSQSPTVPALESAAPGSNAWTDDKYDSIVPFGPYAFNDRNPAAPAQSGFINIAFKLVLSSAHTYGFQDMTNGSNYVSLESAMNSSPYLQFPHAQQKLIEAESMMEPIRLLEAILDERDGLSDYRSLITSSITYGSNIYQQYLATSGNTIPFWPSGFTPKFGLDRFNVTKIDRTLFKPIDAQVWNVNGIAGGRQSFFFPMPARTGVMTMSSFTRPVSANGGKMRTMAARILTRLLPAPDAYVPKNQSLHKSYFLTTQANDPHLQPSCIGCHINLDPLVRALYPSAWSTNPVLAWMNGSTPFEVIEVGGAGSNANTGHKGVGAFEDQEITTGWEGVAAAVSNSERFALNTVTLAYNNLYHTVGFPPSEHNAMIAQVAKNFMANGYNYRSMLLDLLTYQGYFEAAP